MCVFSVVSSSWDTMDYSPPGSTVHGFTQARILEWVAISFTRGYSWSWDRTPLPTLQVDSLPAEPPGIFTFQYVELFKRLSSGGRLALQFIYSVSRGGCFIWKQLSFLAIKERKFMLSIDVPQKSEKKLKKKKIFIIFRQLDIIILCWVHVVKDSGNHSLIA